MHMDNEWGCPVCGEEIHYGTMHEHPFVPFQDRPQLQSRPFVLKRRCRYCNKVRFMLSMVYIRRPAGGPPYWTCRPCLP
ncbi:MAG: hypothetical protein QOG21_1358 [Actinomycetota bacterium]|jgi:hypothetical protein|nr:hypothetical protein [Actinomycetota bacterium]